MLAKLIKNRGGSARRRAMAAIEYALPKAAAITVNHLPAEVELASRIMLLTMAAHPRIRDPFLHIVYSMADEEIVGADEMLMSGARLLEKIGGEAHQALIAVHDVFHGRRDAHLLINRIHPNGGPTLSLFQPHRLIERACRELELEFGWPHDRGHFEWEAREDGGVVLGQPDHANTQYKIEMRKVGLLTASTTQFQHEKQTGRPSLRTVLSGEGFAALRRIFDTSRNWREIDVALEPSGLEVQHVARGGRIAYPDGKMSMRLSELGSDYSFTKIDARFREAAKAEAQKKFDVPEESETASSPAIVHIIAPSEVEAAAYEEIDGRLQGFGARIPSVFDAREILFNHDPQLLKRRRHTNADLKNWNWHDFDDPLARQRNDHVGCRQKWELASDPARASEIGIDEVLLKTLTPFYEGIRLADAKSAVLRQRLDNRTVGFSVVDWQNDCCEILLAKGGRPGICALGSPEAEDVCFVATPGDAMVLALTDPSVLTVFAHPDLADLPARLRKFMENRTGWIALKDEGAAQHLFKALPELYRDNSLIMLREFEEVIYEAPELPSPTPRLTFEI